VGRTQLPEKKLMGRFLGLVVVLAGCSGRDISPSAKHFGDAMTDLKVFHDNLTDAVLAGDFETAGWLAEGLDTTLVGMVKAFPAHRVLKKPFGDYYDELLEPEMSDLKIRIAGRDTLGAIRAVYALTVNCNTCHRRHDQEKPRKFLQKSLLRLKEASGRNSSVANP
jgi:hypothetical protein